MMSPFLRTSLLMAFMTALFMGVGGLLGGSSGALFALVFAAGLNVVTWWNSDRMVLAMHGARHLPPGSSPLQKMVAQLAARAELPIPEVYLIETDQPNAFATGRSPERAAVAVTQGLLRSLSSEELAGVIAHELAHIKNRDTLIMTITATFAGAISMLANFALFFGGNRDRQMGILGTLAMMFLAPLAASLVQMAISRTREYEADRVGALICGNPLWLASALRKIDASARVIDNHQAERNPATAHMFIINPLHVHGHDNLFSTHPKTANRVAELEKMARGGYAHQNTASVPRVSRGRGRQGPWA